MWRCLGKKLALFLLQYIKNGTTMGVRKKCENKEKALPQCFPFSIALVLSAISPLGKCHFLPGGGLLKIGEDQVLFLRSKGGSKDFFKLKRGYH